MKNQIVDLKKKGNSFNLDVVTVMYETLEEHYNCAIRNISANSIHCFGVQMTSP